MDCTTCSVFEAFVSNSSSFVDQMVSDVQGPMTALLIAMAGVWIVWLGLQITMGALDAPHTIKQLVFFVLGFGVFMGVDTITATVFDTAISVLGGLSASITGFSGEGTSGISSLLMAVETEISKVITIVSIFVGEPSGVWGTVAFVMRAIYGIALLIPFGLLLVLFLSQTATCLFRIALICGLSPFVVAMSAFPFGAGLFAQAIRTLIGAITTMLAVTLVFSLVTKCFDILQIGGESSLSPDEFASLASGPYLLALLMGWLGCALMSEAISVAGSVAGAMLGSVGAGTLTARGLQGAQGGIALTRWGLGGAFNAGKEIIGKIGGSGKGNSPKAGDITTPGSNT